MVPLSRQIGYMTDAYCADWVYGKDLLLTSSYAHVFSEKIESGQYTLGDVGTIARRIFSETPEELLFRRGGERLDNRNA